MQRECDAGCGTVYEARTARHRFCSARCRKRGQRAGGQVVALPPAVEPAGLGAIASAVRAELARVDRATTSAGLRAIHLAGLLESPTADSGSSKAALDKQLAAAMAEALDGARRAADPLDELEARRVRRRA